MKRELSDSYTNRSSLIKRGLGFFPAGGVLPPNYKRLHETARSITVKVFKPCHYEFRL